MIKTLESIDVGPLLQYYLHIKDKIWWLDSKKCLQASLQYKSGDDPAKSGLGRSTGHDLQFNQLNSFSQNSVFENIISKFNLKRTRLMIVEPWSCYSMHRDISPRIHIPLITNPECYFVFKEGGIVQHLPVGQVYWVDTTQYHTFINCSAEQRVHLMGSVEN